MRLDKLLSQSGEYSRSQAQALVRAGRVRVGGAQARDPAQRLLPGDEVTLDGSPVAETGKRYILLNKPSGLLTAARDSRQPTVMALLPREYALRGVMPVGRLDKDTTGALLLTDDGELCHRLLSPKRHVEKVYLATVDGLLTEEDVFAFREGLALSDFIALPAKMTILSASEKQSVARVTVCEGKFHQIKRMFLSRGREVTALRREAFGCLGLTGLDEGRFRALTREEIAALYESAGMRPPADE